MLKCYSKNKTRIFMKKSIFFAAAFMASVAVAEGSSDLASGGDNFQQRKSNIQRSQQERADMLQAAQNCVTAASNSEVLKACQEQGRASHKGFREKKGEERKMQNGDDARRSTTP
jgi:hypothetical protein